MTWRKISSICLVLTLAWLATLLGAEDTLSRRQLEERIVAGLMCGEDVAQLVER